MSELTDRLQSAGLEHRGTDLGGLLQWAALHIASQDEALAEARSELDAERYISGNMSRALANAADAADQSAKSLRDAIPADISELLGRDLVPQINLMGAMGDPDYLRANGMTIRHVDTRTKKPNAARKQGANHD